MRETFVSSYKGIESWTHRLSLRFPAQTWVEYWFATHNYLRGKTGASYGAIAVMRQNRSSHGGDSGTNSNTTGTRWEGRKLKSRLFQLQINWILLSSEFHDNDWKRSDLICYWPCRGGAYLKNSSFEPTARHSTQDCLQVHTKSLQIGCFELTECQSTRS